MGLPSGCSEALSHWLSSLEGEIDWHGVLLPLIASGKAERILEWKKPLLQIFPIKTLGLLYIPKLLELRVPKISL